MRGRGLGIGSLLAVLAGLRRILLNAADRVQTTMLASVRIVARIHHGTAGEKLDGELFNAGAPRGNLLRSERLFN